MYVWEVMGLIPVRDSDFFSLYHACIMLLSSLFSIYIDCSINIPLSEVMPNRCNTLKYTSAFLPLILVAVSIYVTEISSWWIN